MFLNAKNRQKITKKVQIYPEKSQKYRKHQENRQKYTKNDCFSQLFFHQIKVEAGQIS
jgi:hypothetical protein